MLSAKDNIYVQLQQKNKHWDMSMYVSFSENKTTYLYIRCKEQTLNISIQKTYTSWSRLVKSCLWPSHETTTRTQYHSSRLHSMSDSELEVNFDFAWRINASDAMPKTPKIAKIKMSLSFLCGPKTGWFSQGLCSTKRRVNCENTLHTFCIYYIYIDRRGPSIHISPK